MATRDVELKSGCFARAEPDEPLFVLMGRDWLAPWLVFAWSWLRRCQIYIGFKPPSDFERCDEAKLLAKQMRSWRRRRKGRGGSAVSDIHRAVEHSAASRPPMSLDEAAEIVASLMPIGGTDRVCEALTIYMRAVERIKDRQVETMRFERDRLSGGLTAIAGAPASAPAAVLRGIAYDIALNCIPPDVAEYQIIRRSAEAEVRR